MPPASVSLRDIAKAAKVSAMTVSLALRDSGSISPSTRERVKGVAQRMGYRRHPLRALLGREARIGKSGEPHSTLAWLYDTPKREDLYSDPHLRGHLDGAQKRAAELGFALDPIWIGQRGLAARRLADILSARGISALVFHDLREADTFSGRFLCKEYPGVVIGTGPDHPALTRIFSDAAAHVRTALRRLSHKGIERIGFIVGGEPSTFPCDAAAAAFQYHTPRITGEPAIPPLHLESGTVPRARAARLADWIRGNNPQVLLTASSAVPFDAAELPLEPRLLRPVIHLNLPSTHDRATGVHALPERLGATAITHIANLLVRNEPKPPACRASLLIEGEWTGAVPFFASQTHIVPFHDPKSATAVCG